MSFYTWIKRKYIDDNSPKGELARSIKSDKLFFPRSRGHNHILKYLKCRNASESCIHAFELCWKEYVRCEKNL